jgi:C_GCAxxG_C_C family probable redox protein
MSHADDAVELFKSGCNCAQAVLAAFAGPLGISREMALKVACGFGGGMRMAETCGAVTGALMALGLKHGMSRPEDAEAKKMTYTQVADFNARFKARAGTCSCRELLGCDISTVGGMKQAQDQGLFKTRCPELVRCAAEILDGVLSGAA